MLQAIKFKASNGTLEVLDQLLLPHTMRYIKINTVEDGWNVINKMQVGFILQMKKKHIKIKKNYFRFAVLHA